jgi:hypothetical protein
VGGLSLFTSQRKINQAQPQRQQGSGFHMINQTYYQVEQI